MQYIAVRFLRCITLIPLLLFQETALHLACAGDHVKVVKLLLCRGASVIARTVNNQTPLDIAIENRAQLSAAAILSSEK